MALPKIYTRNPHNNGFTLLEVLLVLAMLGFIAATTLVFSIGYFQSEIQRTEEDTLIYLLQFARAKAMQNVDGTAHGVAIDPDGLKQFVLFSGNNFTSADPATMSTFDRSSNFILATSSSKEIVFSQLSGAVVESGDIVFIDATKSNVSSTITVNYEGAIY